MFAGEIKYMNLVTQTDPQEFFNILKSHVETGCNGLYVEIQYQTPMQLDNKIAYSALVIGRVPE